MKLSIAIVNWNTRELLRQCLQSVFDQTQRYSFEIIVVDNASTDGSAEMVAAEFPTVRLIKNEDNRGFAAANNQALRISEGEYFLLLNSDTVVLEGALDALVDFLEEHPGIGGVGARLLNGQGQVSISAYRFPRVLHEFFGRCFLLDTYRLSAYPNQRTTEEPFPVDWPCGACFLVRRTAIEQAGPLDEDFWLYSEEVEWCYRIWKAGWPIYYLPQARVVHYDGSSAAKLGTAKTLLIYKNRYLLFRKLYGPWAPKFLRAGLAGAMLLNIPYLCAKLICRRFGWHEFRQAVSTEWKILVQ